MPGAVSVSIPGDGRVKKGGLDSYAKIAYDGGDMLKTDKSVNVTMSMKSETLKMLDALANALGTTRSGAVSWMARSFVVVKPPHTDKRMVLTWDDARRLSDTLGKHEKKK